MIKIFEGIFYIKRRLKAHSCRAVKTMSIDLALSYLNYQDIFRKLIVIYLTEIGCILDYLIYLCSHKKYLSDDKTWKVHQHSKSWTWDVKEEFVEYLCVPWFDLSCLCMCDRLIILKSSGTDTFNKSYNSVQSKRQHKCNVKRRKGISFSIQAKCQMCSRSCAHITTYFLLTSVLL